jgi:hypothetical protein
MAKTTDDALFGSNRSACSVDDRWGSRTVPTGYGPLRVSFRYCRLPTGFDQQGRVYRIAKKPNAHAAMSKETSARTLNIRILNRSRPDG